MITEPEESQLFLCIGIQLHSWKGNIQSNLESLSSHLNIIVIFLEVKCLTWERERIEKKF